MRILFIHQYFCPPNGYGNNRSYEIAKYWVQEGNEVIMLTSSAHFPKNHPIHHKNSHFEDIDGIQTYILNVPYSHYFGFIKRILAFLKFYFKSYQLIKKIEKTDLIYASSTPPSVGELGRIWSKKWDVPLIFETVDVWPDVPEQMKILNNQWILKYLHTKVEKIYEHSSKIIALSPDMKRQIIEHHVSESKIYVSYNGTNTDYFYPIPKNNKIPKVIYAGAVGKVNDVSNFIEAAKSLENQADFILIGNGNEALKIQKIIQKLKPLSLTWNTWIPKNEVHPYIASCDIGVSTIANYKVLEANSANKFYDYLACGLPVVNNYEGWQKEFLMENNCGLSSKLGNLKEFIQNLEYLIGNPIVRNQMSLKARNVAVSNFHRKDLALDLLRIIKEHI